MKIRKIYTIEIHKALKKTITAVLLVSLVLPLFYTISVFVDASYMDIEGEFNMFMSASVYWKMLQYICLPQILLALLATQSFGYELENGQIKMLLAKGSGRSKLLISKILVNVTLLLASYIIFFLFSYILEWLFYGNTFQLYMFFEWVTADNARFLLVDAIYLINIICISNIVVCLSLFKKPFTSFMVGVGISLMSMLLQYFPIIKYFIPMYVADQLTSYTISTIKAMAAFLIYVIMAVIPVIIAIKKFNQLDIK